MERNSGRGRGGNRGGSGGGRGRSGGNRNRGGRGRSHNNNNNNNNNNSNNNSGSRGRAGGRSSSNQRGRGRGKGNRYRGRGGRGRGGGSDGDNNLKMESDVDDNIDNVRDEDERKNNQKGGGGSKRGSKNGGKAGRGGQENSGEALSRESLTEDTDVKQSKDPEKQQNNSSQKKKNQKSSQKDSTERNKKQFSSKKSAAAPLQPSIPPSKPQTTNDLNYKKGEKIKVLHIAEKPSIAQAIAKGLCPPRTNPSQSRGTLPVHEFTNPPFPKAPKASSVTHRVTSVAGHVFSVDFPPKFQSWDSVDPAELFSAPVVKKPCKGSVVKHLQTECKGMDFLVLWMDCDREGENINFEVLDCCMHLMSRSDTTNYDRVYRAHFSAINPSDITKAYNSLGKPDRNQSLSVDARQELDLKVGVAFSRFQTRYFQGRYGDLDSAVLSYGPCQTPTLGFCVTRHLEMETFQPEPYWVLDLGILKNGRMCRALWDYGRSFNRQKVEGLVQKCLETPGCKALVKSVVSKDKKQGRPTPLNTVAMLKACSKALGLGPHSAMQTAERLYLNGYLSYPRTESTAYPKSFDILGTLQSQASDGRWGPYVRELLTGSAGINKARGGVDMGDHPPITPCRPAGPNELSGDMARLYDLVTRHFIASVSHDAVWRSTRVDIEIDAISEFGKFTIRGKELVSPGFLAIIMHKQYGDEEKRGGEGIHEDSLDDEEEKALPEFNKNEEIIIFDNNASSTSKMGTIPSSSYATLEVKERMTTPPTHLTESELIGKMENNGIGTDASIATHIENIIKRNYVELLMPGRKLSPTKLGLVLGQGYHSIDSSLVLPKVRADIEDQCSKIAKGLADKDGVLKKAIDIFADKFDFFVRNINKMDVLFGSSFAKLEDVGKPFIRCGLTRRYLQYIVGPPPRLYNKFTETVYPLPAGGLIKQWTGQKCPVPDCNFELCLYSIGNPPMTYPLCPYCFNHPNKEWGKVPGETGNDEEPSIVVDEDDKTKETKIQRMGGRSPLILECPHPDFHPLIQERTISPDPDSGGVLVLDPTPNKYRLVSTRAPTILYFPKEVNKVTVLNRTDEVTGCHYMRIEFDEKGRDLPPSEDGSAKYISCFPTDDWLQERIRVYHGSDRMKSGGRGGRGHGRGRGGRGGRGRGGGRGGRRGR